MKRLVLVGFSLAMLAAAIGFAAEEAAPPAPVKEHEWLQQFVGEWEYESEATFAPDQPPFKCKGTEKIRALGGFWIIGESEATVLEMPMHSVITLGYSPEKKKYIGTWVDSMTNHLWHYEGTVDESGKVLSLFAEGPDYTMPGKTRMFKDEIELKSKDHKIMRSSMQTEDGKWVQFMTGHYHRKK